MAMRRPAGSASRWRAAPFRSRTARAAARLRMALVCFALGSMAGGLAFTDLKATAADIFFVIFFIAGIGLTIFAQAEGVPWVSKQAHETPDRHR